MGTIIRIFSILAIVITNFLFSILDVYVLHVDVICIVRVHHIPFGKGGAFAMYYSRLDSLHLKVYCTYFPRTSGSYFFIQSVLPNTIQGHPKRLHT